MDAVGERAGHAVGAVRLAAAGLAVIAVCYGLARFAYGLFVPAFTAEFDIGAAAAGAIASSSYAGYCVAVVAATLATVRWGPRAVATAAGLAAVLGTGLIAIAPGVAVLAVGVVVAGSSTGLASPPLADAVARWVQADRADRVQTVVNAGTGVGVAVSGPIALVLFGSWRLAWATYCAIAVLVTVWVAATIPGGPTRRSPAGAARGPWWRAGTGRLLVAAAALGAGSSAVWVFGRDLVVTAGVSAAASTLMWILLGVAGVAGAFTGDLVARTGLGRAWTAGMLLLAAATAVFALAPGVLPAVFAAAALFGAVYIGLTAVLLVWGTRTYPDAPALGVGAAFLLIAVGQTLAAPALGLLSDFATAPVAFGAAAVAAAGGALALPRG
ncbi:putative MFS family arabinose efflux permease [Pseudonocardia hierapolitana]|uniref:Putative MFS family arabinose efflux permease n=1 Tax=Pseudonocardia hierapolitana TaxID=1128676 RepID=A0A561T3L0_9PSEU|nr:YbfB/YjiJ family MFS transporter [Pseudonocardia hierapolitana]TWF81700.1 putative MFS family arabinose efflux permease [Pseudonocardia hierapolitana]